MNKTILSTRLIMPKPRQGYIIRHDLFEKLNQIHTHKLTVIKGIAGSGKTTLFTSYAESNALPIQWLKLDEECNDASLFWTYLIESLSEYINASFEDFMSYRHQSGDASMSEILKILINTLPCEKPIYLVLDDFHTIRAKNLLTDINYFIANAPDNIHVILLTRETPDLYLTGYEVQGQLLHIAEQDLKMTKEESFLFLKQTLSLSCGDEELSELVQMSDGWIAGLQLLAATLSDKFAMHINTLLVHDYIANEIFKHWEQNDWEFLIFTAVPVYFNQKITQYLIPGVDYNAIFAKLLAQNLMLECIDQEQHFYQYHNLLRDYLLKQFDAMDSEKKRQLHQRAARVFHEIGDEEESLRHLFMLEDYQTVMQQILDIPHNTIHFSFMRKVPLVDAIANFDFAFQKFFYHYYIYDFTTCLSLYELAARYQKKDPRYLAFSGAAMLFHQESFSPGQALITSEQIKAMDSYPLTKALIFTKNAAFQFYQDQFSDALESVNESMQYENHCPSTYVHYFNLTLKTQICEEMGAFHKSISIQEETREFINTNKILKQLHTPTFYVTLAGLYMKQMRLSKADEILTICENELNHYGGQLRASYYYNKVEYLFLSGSDNEAVKLLNDLMLTKPYENILIVSSLLRHMYHAKVMPTILQDQFLTAYENQTPHKRPMNGRLLYANIMYGRGNFQKAVFTLDEVVTIARKQNSSLKITEANLLNISMLINENREEDRILDLYREALYYAAENDIRMPFHVHADAVSKLHQLYGSRLTEGLSKKEQEFDSSIAKMCFSKDSCILSQREQEIIQAVAAGYTNSEIAKKLFISLPTVKTHLSNIFRKLEAGSRVAAVEQARNKGII